MNFRKYEMYPKPNGEKTEKIRYHISQNYA